IVVTMRRGLRPYATVAPLGLAVALHLQAVTWLTAIFGIVSPSPASSFMRRAGSRFTGPAVRRVLVVAALGAAVLAVGAVGARLAGMTAAAFWAAVRDQAKGLGGSARWFVSRSHAIDVANEVMLVLAAPLLLASAAGSGERVKPAAHVQRLAWMWWGPLAMLVIVRPVIGAARD